jgi:hypothetical protein
MTSSSTSDFVDRARRRLPDDEPEWLALLLSRGFGVNIAAIGMRAAIVVGFFGGSSVRTVAVIDGGGIDVAMRVVDRDVVADPGSPLVAAAASALACASAFVGRPRFLFGGGSDGEG